MDPLGLTNFDWGHQRKNIPYMRSTHNLYLRCFQRLPHREDALKDCYIDYGNWECAACDFEW
jgi:hypothetical protein